MENENCKFLDSIGTNIPTLSADGTIYVAIKPICAGLGINYHRQHKNISSHVFYSKLYSIKKMIAKDNRMRYMFCLPQRYIYGWLFSINSKSQELNKYKMDFYDHVLNDSHGSHT